MEALGNYNWHGLLTRSIAYSLGKSDCFETRRVEKGSKTSMGGKRGRRSRQREATISKDIEMRVKMER
jgi:hypothetical protein